MRAASCRRTQGGQIPPGRSGEQGAGTHKDLKAGTLFNIPFKVVIIEDVSGKVIRKATAADEKRIPLPTNVGFTSNGIARFEVTNGSDMRGDFQRMPRGKTGRRT